MTVPRLGSKGKRWAAERVSVITGLLYRRPSFPPSLFRRPVIPPPTSGGGGTSNSPVYASTARRPPPSRQCMQLLNTLLLLRTYQLIHNAFHLLCPWCRFLTKSIFGDQLFPLWVAIVDECKLLVSSHIFYLFFTPDGRADVGELLEIHAIFAIVTIRK